LIELGVDEFPFKPADDRADNSHDQQCQNNDQCHLEYFHSETVVFLKQKSEYIHHPIPCISELQQAD
jgi:hypothetical protein